MERVRRRAEEAFTRALLKDRSLAEEMKAAARDIDGILAS
jgi:hypothetical protein